MKLVDKISLWLIGVVFLVTPVSMYITYNNIKTKIDNAEVERMTSVNQSVAQQLQEGEEPESYTMGRPIQITEIQGPLPENRVEVEHRCGYNKELNYDECLLKVNSYFDINHKKYLISSYNYVSKSNQILSGLLSSVIWKMLLIGLVVIISARFISKVLLSPFRKTLSLIQTFNLSSKEKLQLPHTKTKEFRELNCFVKKMTDRAMDEYAAVKDFSENASHELQTPLAILRSKLELLSDTNINKDQAGLIEDMQNAIDKLTRINRSLTILTRLENHEFNASEKVNICQIIKESLIMYEDWITLKNISLKTACKSNIILQIHPTLAEILISNLVSNAIRHNMEGGSISIVLDHTKFCITNTGDIPELPTEELFQRFRKSRQSADSIGLGLSIVKQICEVNHFTVTYQYADGFHTVWVQFNATIQTDTSSENISGVLNPAI